MSNVSEKKRLTTAVQLKRNVFILYKGIARMFNIYQETLCSEASGHQSSSGLVTRDKLQRWNSVLYYKTFNGGTQYKSVVKETVRCRH
jgi:hypothetical protein